MKKISTKNWIVCSSILACILIVGVVMVGKNVWDTYKLEIVELQKEQLLITVQVLADSMEDTIQYRVEDLEDVAELVESSESSIMDQVLEKSYVNGLVLKDAEGDLIWGNEENSYVEMYGMSQLTSDIQLIEYRDSDANIVFVLEKQLADGSVLEMELDLTSYYNDLMSTITVGTNGYIVVKNSDGIIFMHPEEVQLGIDVIDGRSEIYEDVDLSSLEELVEKQEANEEGVYEYYSYWWTHEDVPRVEKIAAHSHVNFDNDFLVVSAVMDYDDIYVPIEGGFNSVMQTVAMVVGIVLFFLASVMYLLMKQKKNEEEIIYLKELNQVLEETKRTEETISHQQRLQIMGTMTGGIAHEFNNMLTPIMGYAELLQCTVDHESDEYEYTSEILDAAERAKEVIRDIAKLSRKNMETVFNYVPITKVMKRSMKMVYSLCPTNIHIIEDYKVCVKDGILCNETQINQVLLNLCVNAFHAIEDKTKGEVIVSSSFISAKEMEEEYALKLGVLEVSYIQIMVRDNGCGMEKATMDQIFNPFFTTKVGGQGTGLGLSVVEQIVHSHRGHIIVRSELGKGSSFHMFFPYVADVPDTRHIIREEELKNLRVIALDDNGKILRLLEKTLKKGGIELETCSNVEEATQKLEHHSYDVLLIDQHLTHANVEDGGIDFTITMASKYPNIIKIIMVDQIRKEVIEAKQKGFIDAYLEKPISDTMIIEEIHKLCNLNKV